MSPYQQPEETAREQIDAMLEAVAMLSSASTGNDLDVVFSLGQKETPAPVNRKGLRKKCPRSTLSNE